MELIESIINQISLLEIDQKVELKKHFVTTGRLDYDKADIYLYLDNAIELFRLNSCKKEPETVSWLEKNIDEGTIFFDVGANIGAYSLIAASLLSKMNGMVYSFEPSASTFAKLSANTTLNGFLHSKIFQMNLALDMDTKLASISLSSLEAGSAMHTINHSTHDLHSTVSTSVQPTIHLRIDDLIKLFQLPAPNLIKIDVDGNEHNVLKGALQTLDHPDLKTILVEITEETESFTQISALLERKRFNLVELNKHSRSGISNAVFSR